MMIFHSELSTFHSVATSVPHLRMEFSYHNDLPELAVAAQMGSRYARNAGGDKLSNNTLCKNIKLLPPIVAKKSVKVKLIGLTDVQGD